MRITPMALMVSVLNRKLLAVAAILPISAKEQALSLRNGKLLLPENNCDYKIKAGISTLDLPAFNYMQGIS
jgi:hypothetical protein